MVESLVVTMGGLLAEQLALVKVVLSAKQKADWLVDQLVDQLVGNWVALTDNQMVVL
jgi:hypothetical protein